jgi:hypothetical protein
MKLLLARGACSLWGRSLDRRVTLVLGEWGRLGDLASKRRVESRAASAGLLSRCGWICEADRDRVDHLPVRSIEYAA